MRSLLIVSSFILIAFSSIYAQKTNELQTVKRPKDYNYLSAPDSLGIRKSLKQPTQSSSKIHLPYPIILIHGLNSSSETWDSLTDFFENQYGLNYGGRFDFCLNYTGNNATASTKFYPDSGADIAFFTNPNDTTQIKCGDFYCVNFDVGNDGSVFPSSSSPYYVLSNQSAIVKQGLAVKYAIQYVLQKTRRDKVILMGHSMGGLASREYIQNPSNWQSDGKYHVAKLVTTGTPHGGSNSSMTQPIDWCTGIDDPSEAVRDLKTII